MEKLENNKKVKSATNITAAGVSIKDITPNKGRILVSLKSWPAHTDAGIIMSGSSVIIRGEQYITEVESVGSGVSLVKKGDVCVISMYSGYHVSVVSGHVKMISEADILSFKTKQAMEKTKAFNPATFSPGINYILIKLDAVGEVTTAAGIITNVDAVNKASKNDSATKTAEIVAIGPINESTGREFSLPKKGEKIVLDAFVGLKLNDTDINTKEEYRVMYIFDILGFIGTPKK